MAVQMPYRPEGTMPLVERSGDGRMIRIIVMFDTPLHLGRTEPARVHRHAAMR